MHVEEVDATAYVGMAVMMPGMKHLITISAQKSFMHNPSVNGVKKEVKQHEETHEVNDTARRIIANTEAEPYHIAENKEYIKGDEQVIFVRARQIREPGQILAAQAPR